MVGEVTERMAVARPTALSDEIKARIASGIVLGAVALAANWAGQTPFAVLVAVIALVMNWEWSRVVRAPSMDLTAILQLVAVAAAVGAMAIGQTWVAIFALGLAVVATLAISRDQQPIFSAAGVLYVGLPAIALIWLRRDEQFGAQAILFIYAIVWTTDTFAYTCGKLIGGPKLWPAMSPMKTWAGTLGGIGFAAVAGLCFAYLVGHPAPAVLGVLGVLLSVAAQSGDLAESAIKRNFAVKHASLLIPGHGGFMDRMDGIVAAAAAAALLAASRDPQLPARALLFWS